MIDAEIIALSEKRERAVDELQRHVVDFMTLGRAAFAEEELYDRLLTVVHELCAAILDCEQAELTRDEIVHILEPVRGVHTRSWAAYALGHAITQQHHNLVRHRAARIMRTLQSNPGQTRIASIACGSSPDLRLIRDDLPALAGELWLSDGDADALRFSREALRVVDTRLRVHDADALDAVRRLPRHAFDLVSCGGRFDSLHDREAALFIEMAYRLLVEGGVFFFTNIAAGNPYRPLIEYFGNWPLHERNEEHVYRLCEEARIGRGNVAIRREETGLALMVEITKLE